MNKIKFVTLVAVFLGPLRPAAADTFIAGFPAQPANITTPPPSPNTPASLKALADGLHIVDNGTAATLRDVINGNWLLGVTTTVYKKYYLSADGGLASLADVANAHALYFVNGRAWVGQFAYDKIPQIKQFADSYSVAQTILQYGTVGVWGGRDFDYGRWRAGYDVGFTVKFGAGQ